MIFNNTLQTTLVFPKSLF